MEKQKKLKYAKSFMAMLVLSVKELTILVRTVALVFCQNFEDLNYLYIFLIPLIEKQLC